MAWDQARFLDALRAAVDDFDRERTEALCAEFVRHLEQGEDLLPGMGRKVLATLRRKCYFDLMERVADALRDAEADDLQVRRQYAQALIDQGKISAAIYVLEPLAANTADAEERAEARGLLGRVYKQLYVNAVNADSQAVGHRRTQQHLQKSLTAYRDVYRADTTRLWHGINTVALAVRAATDRVSIVDAPDAAAIARDIAGAIETTFKAAEAEGKRLDPFDLATALEASIALGQLEQAQVWLGRYVMHDAADAFELSSTERQLREVWRLSVETPPGSLILPVLQSSILKRKFGRVDLVSGEVDKTIQRVDETIRQAPRLEKVLGKDSYVSLGWYRTGLERCRGVAQIRNANGDGIGTGFLVRGTDLAPGLGEALVLLTNAHVVSNDPIVQRDKQALDPDEAVVAFEALETVQGQTFRVTLLWTSPPGELDATLLRLDRPVSGPEPFPVAKQLPRNDGAQKVYVIGHPRGGGLSLSLTDNALLDYDDRLLHYRAPTEGGSSGSPVFNNQWRLIALHHAGGFDVPKLNGHDGTYDANEGIQLLKIAAAVQAAGVRP
jgi:V8-like Glu-specific endopeptidase